MTKAKNEPTKASEGTKDAIQCLFDALEMFRDYNEGSDRGPSREPMSIRLLEVFCYVSLHEGATTAEMREHLNIPKAPTYRAISALGARGAYNPEGRREVPGFELLKLVQDEVDARAKRVFLTRRGRMLADNLKLILTQSKN